MDLRQVVMTTFLLLETEWSAAKGRALVDILKPTHVIVHWSDSKDYYYLYTFQKSLDHLELADHTLSVQEAFNLYEIGATPLVEIYTNAEGVPDRCIVFEDGCLAGFFDASLPPDLLRSHRGERERPEPEILTSRSLVAEFPVQIELDELASLLVSLSTYGEFSGNIPVEALPLGATVDIIVQARRSFVLEGRSEGSLTITDTDEGLPLQFKLRSTALGLERFGC